jgi:hypothetical protein
VLDSCNKTNISEVLLQANLIGILQSLHCLFWHWLLQLQFVVRYLFLINFKYKLSDKIGSLKAKRKKDAKIAKPRRPSTQPSQFTGQRWSLTPIGAIFSILFVLVL